jgi:hypothetical protein
MSAPAWERCNRCIVDQTTFIRASGVQALPAGKACTPICLGLNFELSSYSINSMPYMPLKDIIPFTKENTMNPFTDAELQTLSA